MPREAAPMVDFDVRIIQAPLQGLLRNMDSEMVRRFKKSMATRDAAAERTISLLLIMLRFTKNSYEAVSFICSSADDSPKRKKEFVFVLPPINRQLMDLLFSLIFMIDDFPVRSVEYELSGYRQAREYVTQYQERFGTNPDWQSHFSDLHGWMETMEKYLTITPEQKAEPENLRYWQNPNRLAGRTSKSQDFLKYLLLWFYDETSAQAHLNAKGLQSFGAALLPEFAPPEDVKHQKDMHWRILFRQFSRTLLTVLAISSEIDTFLNLKNRETLAQLWVLLGGYVEEASDLYSKRYQSMLSEPQERSLLRMAAQPFLPCPRRAHDKTSCVTRTRCPHL